MHSFEAFNEIYNTKISKLLIKSRLLLTQHMLLLRFLRIKVVCGFDQTLYTDMLLVSKTYFFKFRFALGGDNITDKLVYASFHFLE